MMQLYRNCLFLLCLHLLAFTIATGQSVPVGDISTDNDLRILQLQGKLDLNNSLCARPFFHNSSYTNSGLDTLFKTFPFHAIPTKTSFIWLPVQLTTQFNSHHPFGWNDGSMIPAKGLQSMVSIGAYAKVGPLSVQLMPEYVYAANTGFENTKYFGAATYGKYAKLFPGQSSLRLTYKAISLGISTENIWWGPGIHSSLIMSNNAPGFTHITFNTVRPVKTPIGYFEWQLIGGRLEYDSSLLFQNFNLQSTNPFTSRSLFSGDWRYLNGITLNWQPKWVKGLFIGINRIFQSYHRDLNQENIRLIDKYLPIFGTLFKQGILASADTIRSDQALSVFARWVFPNSHSEIYFDYGFNDHSVNLRDFAMSPSHSAAYTAGFKKLFVFNNKQLLDVGLEITQLQESPDYMVRMAGNWYEHSQVLEGYSHNNQTLGAASGRGNNVQTLYGTLVKGVKKLGIKLERIQNTPLDYRIDNNQFNFTLLHPDIKWNDYSIAFNGQLEYQRFIFYSQLQFIQSSNYGWMKDENRLNFHGVIKLLYRL